MKWNVIAFKEFFVGNDRRGGCFGNPFARGGLERDFLYSVVVGWTMPSLIAVTRCFFVRRHGHE
eukprot:scaffold4510_cov183-Amphora_coffeaeformis.AAC.81